MKIKEEITLCNVCYRAFCDGTSHKMQRTKSEIRETCDYCNYRLGWEFEITEKKRSEN